MHITYQIAMAAGKEAANRQMKADGRSAWSAEDFDRAAAVTSELLSIKETAKARGHRADYSKTWDSVVIFRDTANLASGSVNEIARAYGALPA